MATLAGVFGSTSMSCPLRRPVTGSAVPPRRCNEFSSQGDRLHPALGEPRQQVTFARLLTALRITSGEGTGAERTQRHGQVRGVYGITGVS